MASAQEASRALQSLKTQKQEGAMKALSVEQVNKFKDSMAEVGAQKEQEKREHDEAMAVLNKVEVSKDDVSAFAASALLTAPVAQLALRKAKGDVSAAMVDFVNSEPYPDMVRFTANVIA